MLFKLFVMTFSKFFYFYSLNHSIIKQLYECNLNTKRFLQSEYVLYFIIDKYKTIHRPNY